MARFEIVLPAAHDVLEGFGPVATAELTAFIHVVLMHPRNADVVAFLQRVPTLVFSLASMCYEPLIDDMETLVTQKAVGIDRQAWLEYLKQLPLLCSTAGESHLADF